MNCVELKKVVCNTVAFLMLVLVISISGPVWAQVAGGTITGTISDPSSAAIPNVQISIKDTARGVTRTVTTDAAGLYSAPNLLPGMYEVTAEAPGFQKMVQTGVTLTVGAQLVLNFALQVGQVSQTVEVSGQALDIQLSSSALSAEVNSTTVRELPLNGRDWSSLATLQPGVISMASSQDPISGTSSTTARGIRGFGNQFTINGGRSGENNYRIDGISANDYSNSSPSNSLGTSTGVDAIAEFSVLTSNYSAEYGRTAGGVINAITRSGTNQFHGDVYEFLRNSDLDARNFFDPAVIPPFRRNQFGVSAGAPIRKNKTFIFGNYEGLRQALGVTEQANVPSPAADTGILNFASPSQFPTGCTATAVANQCSLTVSPLITPYLALWRAPNDGLVGLGNTGIYSFGGDQASTENFGTVRIDNKFTDSDSLDGSFQYDKATTTLPDTLNDMLVAQATKHVLVMTEWNHTFNASLLNTVRGGYNRSYAQTGTGLSALNPASADMSLGAVSGYDAPLMQPAGLTSFGGGLNSSNQATFVWNSFQGYDDAFWTKGIHNIKFGVAVERMQDNYIQISHGGGLVGFGSLANFLTDIASTFQLSIPSGLTPRGLRQTLVGTYLQDDIHWRPNLTFNVGLRYEMATAPEDNHGELGRLLSPTATTITTGNPYFQNPTLRNFEPRVGFAWDPFKDGKTSVRGGFGIFDVLPFAYEYSNMANNSAPFSPQGNVSNLPQGAFPTEAVALALNPGATRVTYIQPDPPRNYVMQWNLSVQRELVHNLSITAAYVGNRGVHMEFRADDMNGVQPTLTSAGYLWPDPIGSGTKLNPLFGRIDEATWGNNSFYDALEVIVQKTISHGLQIQGSYTWGKAIDGGSGSYLADPYVNSVANLFGFAGNLNRAVSDFNIAQNLVINYDWLIPSPKNLPSAANWALGGWEVGGIFSAKTGLPFTPVLAGDPLGYGTEDDDMPNRLRGSGCQTAVNPGNPNNYINLNCFTLPMATPAIAAECVPFTGLSGTCSNLFGNSGRNSVIGPGLVDLDFSVFKNNYIRRISESFNVQFRAEMFNILNHANFNSPTDNETLYEQSGGAVGGAGRIDSTSTTAREIQFAIKVIW